MVEIREGGTVIWTRITWTRALILVCVAPIGAVISGAVVFIPIAAVFGFFGWLFGADSPREVALYAGAIGGGIWALVEFMLKMWQLAAEVQKQRERRLVARMTGELDL